METLGKIVLFIVLIPWALLFLDCLFRRKFYPLFKTHFRAKVFWLLTFLLMSPVTLILYWFFGRRKEPKKEPSANVKWLVVVVVLLVLAFRFTTVLKPGTAPVTFERNAQGQMVEKGGPIVEAPHVRAALAVDRTGTNSTTVKTGGERDLFSGKHIAVVCMDSHPILARTGLAMARQMAEDPAVESVRFRPKGRSVTDDGPPPDALVTLSLDSRSVIPLLLYRYTRATVRVSAESIPTQLVSSGGYNLGNMPVLSFAYSGQTQCVEHQLGFESAGARYSRFGKQVAAASTGALLKKFQEWRDEHPGVDDLPQAFYGTYREPELDLSDEWDLERVYAVATIYRHCDALYLLHDERPPEDVMAALTADLEEDGWEVRRVENRRDEIVASNGQRRIHVEPEERPMMGGFGAGGMVFSTRGTPYRIQYLEHFEKDEIQAANAALLEGDAPMGLVLTLSNNFRGELHDQFRERLLNYKPTSGQEALAMADFHRREGDAARAEQDVLWARVFELLDVTGVDDEDLEEMAEDLEKPDLLERPLGGEVFKELGFVDVTDVTEPLRVEVGYNESVLVMKQSDGGPFHWGRFQVIQQALQDGKTEDRVEYAISVENDWRSEGTVGRDWTFRFGDAPMRLTVEAASEDRFQLTIAPAE